MSDSYRYLGNEMYEITNQLRDLTYDLEQAARRMENLQENFFLYIERMEDERDAEANS